MICETLTCLAEELNKYIMAQLQTTERKVLLSPLTNPGGSLAAQGGNGITVTLVSVNMATGMQNRLPRARPQDPLHHHPPAGLELQVLFSSYSTAADYAESLKLLYLVIDFFHQKPFFGHPDTPGLHPRIERITLHPEPATPEQTAHIWSALGADYRPSVLYKAVVQLAPGD